MEHQLASTWSFDVRHGAESAGHAAVVLSAFSLTIIVLLIGSPEMRKDRWSAFIVRPFLLAFVGNMIAAFQFMMVESDTTLTERTFALMMPPVTLIVMATMMMLFGIILAVLRYLPDEEVTRLSLWLFVLVALYCMGAISRAMSDLFHVHAGLSVVDLQLTLRVAWLVWGPGVLLLPLELLLERSQIAPERLHTANLWWCSLAMLIAIGMFGLVILMEGNESLHGRFLPTVAVLVAGAQWLVLGLCYHLLRKIGDLRRRFPLPTDAQHSSHVPHVHA